MTAVRRYHPSFRTVFSLHLAVIVCTEFASDSVVILTPFTLCILVFRVIKAKFSEVVEHLRTIEESEESHIQRYARCASLLASLECSITPLLSLEECTFLVVALTVGNIVIFVCRREIIAIFEPSHSCLVVGIGGVIPAHHTCINELWTLRTHIAPPVLENHVCIRRNGFYAILIVVFDIANRSVRLGTAKSVAKVHTEAVHLVLGKPVSE